MDSRLEQAKEWAWGVTAERIPDTSSGRAKLAAAKVIQSLPDQWIDADKVREVISEVLASTLPGTVGRQVAEDYADLIGELIPAPPLPTLADMTPEEREACQWMQADVKLANGGSATCVIANLRMPGARVRVWAAHGGSDDIEEGRITPLPDLPKLEWPGSHADTITAESVEDVQAGRVADFEPAMPRPKDVPVGEAWLVSVVDRELEFVALKTNNPEYPWAFADRDDVDYFANYSIELVSRLVPEHKENA